MMKKRSARMVAAAAVLSGAAFVAPSAEGSTAGVEHYPDLRTLKPADLNIARQDCELIILKNCKTHLRFSNTVWNAGDGRLELRPENDASSRKTTAKQRIWSHDGSGKWSLAKEVSVGEFVFHTSHNHWHFEGFANYDLRNENADGSIGNNVHRSSQKTTFCVIDTDRIDGNLAHSASQTYTNCGQTDITGLTVGWGDKYGFNLPGQSIDITHVRDGRYWLVSTADFKNRLLETNDDNNWAAVKIEIIGDGTLVRELESRSPS